MSVEHFLLGLVGVSFVSQVPNFESLVCSLLVGDHHWVGGLSSWGWRVTLQGMVGDHPWQLSTDLSFVGKV